MEGHLITISLLELLTQHFPSVVKCHILNRVRVTFDGPLKISCLIVPHLMQR